MAITAGWALSIAAVGAKVAGPEAWHWACLSSACLQENQFRDSLAPLLSPARQRVPTMIDLP